MRASALLSLRYTVPSILIETNELKGAAAETVADFLHFLFCIPMG